MGEANFAAGDRVITASTTAKPRSTTANAGRWPRSTPRSAGVVLDGIDQAGRVEAKADYLVRTNPYSDSPALEHAYAVTTYSAQGTTADTAFVMVNPLMDKQELYVAASRSREETFFYATPEVQSHREEIAPVPNQSRDALPHIAVAAERDRAQIAAHDAALRSQFSGLPTEELVAGSDDLRIAASHEAKAERQLRDLRERIERAEQQIERYDAQRERTQELKRRFRKGELARIDRDEARSQERLTGLEAEAHKLPAPSGSARPELAAADRVLAERRELAVTAARISPPAYIMSELGKRPSDPTKRKAWDRGVEAIETYRQRHSIKDPHKALGRERDRERQRETLRRIHEAQRALGLGPHAAQERALGRSLGIGR